MRRRLNARARAFLRGLADVGSFPFVVPMSIERQLLAARCIAPFGRDVHVNPRGAYAVDMYTLSPRGRARALTLVEGSPERLRTLRPRRPRVSPRAEHGPYFARDMLYRLCWRRRETEALLTGGPLKPVVRRHGFAPAGHSDRMRARLEATTAGHVEDMGGISFAYGGGAIHAIRRAFVYTSHVRACIEVELAARR